MNPPIALAFVVQESLILLFIAVQRLGKCTFASRAGTLRVEVGFAILAKPKNRVPSDDKVFGLGAGLAFVVTHMNFIGASLGSTVARRQVKYRI